MDILSDPPLWAGVECTVNRVGDRYRDQLARSGHDRRCDDLDLLAALGFRTVRYPLLWERALGCTECSRASAWAPRSFDAIDWRFADERIGRLRALGVTPVVGLVHHGSGVPGCGLLDPGFPEAIAAYAGALARRFPDLRYFTPINEPLTTARFAGLYGHWHPHGRSGRLFARALLAQLRATMLAMAAIRAVNPQAELWQTDDLGHCAATPRLRYQADFENERRFLSWDLLCGKVEHGHPLFGYLRSLDIPEEDLAFFLEHPCPPDLIGVNYYTTSDRFLDDRCERYPGVARGGNGRHGYVDVEQVRVAEAGLWGHRAALAAVWARYQRPVALTEVHLGGDEIERGRWLYEAWIGARAAAAAGADVRGVTAWAAFGSFDWDSLVTEERGSYEPGLFCVASGAPRPTAAAVLAQALLGGDPVPAVFQQPGWWRRPERVIYPAPSAPPPHWEPPPPGLGAEL